MFRHRGVILREWHPDAEICRSFTLVMNCICCIVAICASVCKAVCVQTEAHMATAQQLF
jgi:hypothetical protein